MTKKWFCFVICSVLVLFCTSCTTPGETPDQPVVVTIWHVYGAQTDSPLNDMISTFNQTVGKEQGIQVEVTLVSNNKNIQELLCRGWFLPPNTYDCGSFVVNGTAVVGKEQNIPYNC